jgi:hypothetical protein
VTLPEETRLALQAVLARRPEVRRAIFTDSTTRPTVAFEYDERPPSVEAARAVIQALFAAVGPVLGSLAREVGFSAGGPQEIAPVTGAGVVIYERE